MLAQRVFHAVPLQEYWSVNQISNEMSRLEKHNHSRGEITGCLRCLVDAGLVGEAGTLTFRAKFNSKQLQEEKEKPMSTKKNLTVSSTDSLIQRINNKAAQLRHLADEIELLGIEVIEAIQEAGQSNEKLLKLQSLLREITGDE